MNVVNEKQLKRITGARLLRLRERLQMNQKDFWSSLGVTQSGGSRYENERNVPLPVRMLALFVFAEEWPHLR